MKTQLNWQGNALLAAAVLMGFGASLVGAAAPEVATLRVPHGGIQPQVAVDGGATIHLAYYNDHPRHGNVFYVRSTDGGATFSSPIRVNSQPGSAVAAGNIRGAQLAVGKAGRVHVVWNGSSMARPKGPLNPRQPKDSPHNGTPMLYARMNADRTAFEPQRNLMRRTFALDGGGTVAADQAGNVYVAWHAASGDAHDESGRRVWLARSGDDGTTFTEEQPISDATSGACGCCGMNGVADGRGNLYFLFRTAAQHVNRNTQLLFAPAGAKDFRELRVHRWITGKCPMSAFSLAEANGKMQLAWETGEQVFTATYDAQDGKLSRPVSPAGFGTVLRKHPVLAVNNRGDVLLAWTEGMTWAKAGRVAWQVFDSDGKLIPGTGGGAAGVPAWSLVAAFARPDGGFTVVY